ncbi:MAG TPA: protein kinase [Candidatus Obscuribacterales bacterium]
MENRLRETLIQTLEFVRHEATESCVHAKKLECLTCRGEFPATLRVCPHDGSLLMPLEEDPLIGESIAGSYKIVAVIGHGGFSTVYKAQHELIVRSAAIKILDPHHKAVRKQLIDRFQQEACAVSSLDHRNIVTLYDFGVLSRGRPYLIMEYVDGVSLADLIEQEGYVPYKRAIHIFGQICDAIEHAHQKGIVHRDLKPSNILLTDTVGLPDFVKVVDFGIATLLPWAEPQSFSITYPEQVFGSPMYMSPEQGRKHAVDARSDIYSLGCAFYHALTGQPPFKADSIAELMEMHRNTMPPGFKEIRPDIYIPQHLETVVFKAVAKEPDQRYQSMAELRRDLEPVPQRQPEGIQPPRKRIRALIVDDSPFMLQAIKTVLGPEGDIEIVGEAQDGRSSLNKVSELQPDVVLMDIGMPVMDGIEATKQIKRCFPDLPIIMFTARDAEDDILAAFRAGADGYCLKNFTAGKLAGAIRVVVQDGNWLDQEIAGRILRASVRALTDASPPLEMAVEPRDKAEHDEALALVALAQTQEQNGRYGEAECLYAAAIAALKRTRGAEADVADALTRLADIYMTQKKYVQAERFYLQALEIRHALLGPGHAHFAAGLERLAEVFDSRCEYAEAEKFFGWALSVRSSSGQSEQQSSPSDALNQIAWVCRAQKKFKEAEYLEARAREMQRAENTIADLST